jgi:Predicted glycosyl hydrolase
MKRYLALILISIFVLIGCLPSPRQSPSQLSDSEQLPQAEASRKDGLGSSRSTILAFYPEGGKDAKDSMMKNIKSIDEVAFFWYIFDETGKINRSAGADLNIKTAAQKSGVKAYAVVHNLSGSQFNSQLAHQVLNSPKIRSNFVKNLVLLTTNENWDGIVIDLEKVVPTDRDNFSSFTNELHSALKAKDKRLIVSLHAKYHDDPNDLWAGANDYAALGKTADQVIIMTYDEHSIGTTQGPIASKGWVNRVINYSTGIIPKEKIIMGIPIYAYDWSSNKPTRPISMSVTTATDSARKHAVNILYDESQEVPHFSFTAAGVRHEVYFENNRSLTAKLDIAKKNQLLGIAIWRLGLENPTMWTDALKNYNRS